MSVTQEITPELVVERLRHVLAEMLEMAPADLEADVPLSAFGIDSMTSSVLLGDLEKWCGAELRAEASLGGLSLTETADLVVAELRQPRKER
ncbi:acyl carrier protein [Streptomyces endophytica]|uniref:Acyl carrier protein n=1 Tax=Streptomyces endophytica TaxID=2991496 RepID=A0ABY6PE54_9ACTN|nr:acyl carrier protein [Streptomyces endophytica]UZJ32115.1 acyl carrier protein [Streptomyces endophytica]